eukprot:CAMPEP_0170574656 /NCGR_PEP_ID=MMETSP0224-20130122/3422_1 /TAXON_ID=285029 /ORGANISM="Togula jolla, Strain CCCM 725" /LENGTH=125 /DNA_ID=CAMNT_0010897339 /DNA_START=426 /DNA_END=804 /DNA_ORIENTATION=-
MRHAATPESVHEGQLTHLCGLQEEQHHQRNLCAMVLGEPLLKPGTVWGQVIVAIVSIIEGFFVQWLFSGADLSTRSTARRLARFSRFLVFLKVHLKLKSQLVPPRMALPADSRGLSVSASLQVSP